MSVSQLFVLSSRGDRVIARDYRTDIGRGSEEIFFRYVKSVKAEHVPVFEVQGIQFVYVKRNNLYFVLTTRHNASPITLLDFLTRTTNLIRDFCGVLSEESIRKNFILIYEILDEILDNGYIQDTETKMLKNYINNEPAELEQATSLMPKISELFMEQKTVASQASRRPVQGGSNKKSEIFVDLLEKINVVFSATGAILQSEILGSLIVKSYVPGDPHLSIGLNENLVIGENENRPYGAITMDSANFHESVDLEQFELNKVLSLNAIDGEATVMNYKISKEYNVPFRIVPYVVKESQFKVKITVTLRNDLPTSKLATGVIVRIPIPKDTTSTSVEFGVGQQNNYEYCQPEQAVLWGIKKFTGGVEQVIKITVVTSGAINYDLSSQIGPISMKFEIPMYNCSGLEVKFLKLSQSQTSKKEELLLYFYAAVAGILLYTLLMGPTEYHKNGIVGWFYRFLLNLPKVLFTTCCGTCFGKEKGLDLLKNLEHYFLYTKHPLLQIVYLGLLSINVALYIFTIFKTIPNIYIPVYHRYTGMVALVLTYIIYLKACFSNPGFITKDTVKKFEKSFEYDEMMYISNRKCETCEIIKPARSKHSILSKKCVSKFDHFCGWLNNDVGELNYRYFHAFLISNFLLIIYAAYIYIFSLLSIIEEENLWNSTFVTPQGQKIQANTRIVLTYMLSRYILPIGQLFFICACGLMIFGFWFYHVYLIWSNTTTNETFKKNEMKQLWKIIKLKKDIKKLSVNELYDEIYEQEEETNNKKAEKKRKEWKLQLLENLMTKAKNNEEPNFDFYNKGFLQNVKEVIFPPSLYGSATTKRKFL
ncbi:hypothetical protein ABK040_005317 [Willaertia magna]